jgi:glycosyltransferase involved in cell wall biosynthesis
MSEVTFIIPTIGRETLEQSINSLLKQDNPNWKAIIIFDGIEPNIKCIDPRISILKCEKKGEGKNGAGNVRNYAVPFIETEWIAFLDDDDTVADDYVTCLQKQIEEIPDLDVLIFRMKHNHLEELFHI